jgi:hypothetical protein
MLLHSGPLGLVHRLLYVETLPFGSIISEDRELMQLKTVLESSPRMGTPSFGYFILDSIPQVMLVHLTANMIPLGLSIPRQEVHQKSLRLGNCLAVNFLGFLDHLSSLPNIQLASLHVILGDSTLRPSSLLKILQHSSQLVYSLGQLPALHVESLLADET